MTFPSRPSSRFFKCEERAYMGPAGIHSSCVFAPASPPKHLQITVKCLQTSQITSSAIIHLHYRAEMRVALVLSALAGLGASVPTTNTCRTSSIIQDGGFESGATPPTSGGTSWTVVGFIGASTYTLESPGSTNSGGNYAFTAILYPGPYSSGVSGDTLTQTMHVCAGKNYSITADYSFSSTASNNCAISLQYPYKTTTGSVTTGSALSPAGVWYTTGATFQAVSSADPLKIVFSCSDGANNRISVDNVKVAPFNGNAF